MFTAGLPSLRRWERYKVFDAETRSVIISKEQIVKLINLSLKAHSHTNKNSFSFLHRTSLPG